MLDRKLAPDVLKALVDAKYGPDGWECVFMTVHLGGYTSETLKIVNPDTKPRESGAAAVPGFQT